MGIYLEDICGADILGRIPDAEDKREIYLERIIGYFKLGRRIMFIVEL